MLIEVVQELLDVLIATLVKVAEVDVDHNVLKVVILFLLLSIIQQLLPIPSTARTKAVRRLQRTLEWLDA